MGCKFAFPACLSIGSLLKQRPDRCLAALSVATPVGEHGPLSEAGRPQPLLLGPFGLVEQGLPGQHCPKCCPSATTL